MRIRLIPKARYLVLIIALAISCSVGVRAQAIRFVQITDPHLFDGEQEGAENKAALAACIKKINEQIDVRADYKFAVITGDIGVENLVSEKRGDTRVEFDAGEKERRLEQGAAQLASLLAASRIRVWLFLPGNNDLLNENPDTLNYYRTFIAKLREKLPGLEVKDLCAEEPENAGDEPGLYRLGGFAFIGFNNASFKNDNDPLRIPANKEKQLEYVRQVVDRVGAKGVRRAYVFYHIPELDDPHIIRNFDDKIPAKRKGEDEASTTPEKRKMAEVKREIYNKNPYKESSWFVDEEVHNAWKNLVVSNANVRGLFAGHYHDWRRDTYANARWMRTDNYLSGSLSKLYVCPPLAVKLQDSTPSQARGFQEVTIDAEGAVSAKVFWLNPADRTFDTNPSSLSSQLQMALFYEGARAWPEAEAAFTEAAKNAPSDAVRDSALAGLKRVREAQRTGFKNTLLRWTDPASLGVFFSRVLIVIGIPLVIFLLYIAVKEGRRAMVIYPFDGDESLSKQLAIGFPALRAAIREILKPSAMLPEIISIKDVNPFVSPRFEDLFPLEPFEIGGIKVPNFSIILKWLVRPRFRVVGGILPLSAQKYVYAEVWRRQTWFGSGLATVVTRRIPEGAAFNIEAENFIIDVYRKTYGVLRKQ